MLEPQEQKPSEEDSPEEEDSEWQEEYAELLAQEVLNTCRCAECCRRLIIEVELEDADREPKIREKGSPIYTDPRLTASGKPELEGYLLNITNGTDMACVFLDQQTNLCTIHETRPLTCRLFDCEGEGREQLIELGILKPKEATDG